MGIARLLDEQQPGNMITLNSTLAEPAGNNKAPKGVKAKEIFLGIDAHSRGAGGCAPLTKAVFFITKGYGVALNLRGK